jgi:hypothetical protein
MIGVGQCVVGDVVQCSLSGALVDHDVPLWVVELPCPTCGRVVPLGGTPKAPRFTIHNEPALSLGDAIVAYYAADATQRAIERADQHDAEARA